MNHQSTLEQLQELKLSGMAKRYEAILNQPVHQQPEPHALIATLAEAESGYRIHQRTQLYLRLSKLRYNATPEQINCQIYHMQVGELVRGCMTSGIRFLFTLW